MIVTAFETAGVEFIDENGGRLGVRLHSVNGPVLGAYCSFRARR
jgi:hypothetical protein